MRGKRLGRYWWLGVILLIAAVVLLFKIIDWFASPHTFRLVAHYSAKATLVESVDPKQVDSSYRTFLEEGEPAVFTEAGLFLFEQGSKAYQADQQEAVIAFRDWRGRRQWAVTLPECEFRNIFASPDGRYLASFCATGVGLYTVWHDGKPVYTWESEDYYGPPDCLIDNAGRLFLWQDDCLTVVKDGKVIATNFHLPHSVQTITTAVDYRLAPDGTAMAGMVCSTDFPIDIYERAGSTPPAIPRPRLDYINLTIRGNKVAAAHRVLENVPGDGNWWFLSGGDIQFSDGTIYTSTGQQRKGNGWEPINLQVYGDSLQLWHGEAALQVNHSAGVIRYRVHHPGNGRTWPLPKGTVDTEGNTTRDIAVSGDGRHALELKMDQNYPPTTAGRVARALSGNATLRKLFSRVPKEYAQFKLYDQASILKAQTICPVTDTEYAPTPVFKIGKRKYAMVSYALSQDGKHLVVLAKSLTGHDREYLHFAW